MKPKIALISLCFVLLFLGGCDNAPPKKSTKVKHKEKGPMWYDNKFVKDTIYILWEKQKFQCEGGMFLTEKERNECFYDNTPYYSKEDEGTVFQISRYHYLIFENGSISDTLKIKNLDAYQIHTANEIEKLDDKWRNSNELTIKKSVTDVKRYYFGYSSSRDRNSMYVTYLIKISENQKRFIVYPVSWYYPPEYIE